MRHFAWIPLATLAVPSLALAEGPAEVVIVEQQDVPTTGPVYVPAAAAPPAPAGAHVHDGLYLRAALGGGYLRDDFHGPFNVWEGNAQGGSAAFELGVGWTIMPGFVLGGMFAADWVQNPTVEGVPSAAVGALTVFGPFVDWYLDPTGGFHLQGLLGASRITIRDETGEVSDHQPVGGALLVGAGYEWFLGDELSLGVLGRLTFATASDDGFAHTVTAGSALVSVTYH